MNDFVDSTCIEICIMIFAKKFEWQTIGRKKKWCLNYVNSERKNQ